MQSTAMLPILGPIVAAVIAGAVAFLASVFSKEQKVSEFRQAWIDALRSDISELVSIATQIGDEIVVRSRQGEDTESLQKHLRVREADFQRLEACKVRIRLRLNPREHRLLLEAVVAMSEPGDHDAKAESLIEESQKVLKAEWKRVKRGEPVFYVSKWLSLLIFFVALAIAGAIVLGR